MDTSWLTIAISGGGGAALVALINKWKTKGDKQKDSSEYIATITDAFSQTLETVQTSSARAIEAADANFKMSTEREKRLLEIIQCDAEYKHRTDEKLAKMDERMLSLAAIISKASDCEFLKDKPNIECPVIKENLKGKDLSKCNNCDTKMT